MGTKPIKFLCCLMIATLFFSFSSVNVDASNTVQFPARIDELFPDDNLAAEIARLMGKTPDAIVTETELKENNRLYQLDISGKGISNLEGIQYLTIRRFNASNNNLVDVSVLNQLPNLTNLNLSMNVNIDISTLGELLQLQFLYLDNTNLTDLNLSNQYPKLEVLSLKGTKIQGLTGVKSTVPNLKNIILTDTPFTDLTELEPWEDTLTLIDISKTNVTEFSPLTNFSNLSNFSSNQNPNANFSTLPFLDGIGVFSFNDNNLLNVNFLHDYTNIPVLYVSGNQIQSSDVLKNISIGTLYLDNNAIEDASWFSDLDQVQNLHANENRIVDISFLENKNPFTTINLREQNIIKQPLHIGKTSYEIINPVRYFDGFMTHLSNQNGPAYIKTNGTYNENAKTVKWEELMVGSKLTYEWQMTLMGLNRRPVISYSGKVNQTVEKIGFDVKYYDGDTLLFEEKNIYEDSILTEPTIPIKEGYRFVSWYRDDKFTRQWHHPTSRIASDIVLYAYFEPIVIHTVTTNMLDGSNLVSYQVESGQTVRILPPTREGYRFIGWYLDQDLTILWDENQPINHSLTLFAAWENENSLQEDTTNTPKTDVQSTHILWWSLILWGSMGLLLVSQFEMKKD